MKPQCKKLVEHMKKHDGITSMDAFTLYGITRLSARIKDLREYGYTVETQRETGRNRDGEKVSYTRYRLGGESSA